MSDMDKSAEKGHEVPPPYTSYPPAHGQPQYNGPPPAGYQTVPQAGYQTVPQAGYQTAPQAGYQPPPQPGYQYSNVVVQQQPMIATSGQQAPNDYLVGAILVTCCCFWPTGIVAVIKANEARNQVARGDVAAANISARSAKTFINISIIIGVIGAILIGILTTLYFIYIVNYVGNNCDGMNAHDIDNYEEVCG